MAARPSYAEQIVVGFTATIFYIDDFCLCVPETITIGDTLIGYYAYESPAVDTNPDPKTGHYLYSTAPSRLVVYVDGYKLASDPDNVDISLTVHDSLDTGSGPRDRYVFSSWSNEVAPFDGDAPTRMFVTFWDATLQALSDDSLPTSPPDFSIWTTSHGIQINGETWVLAANIISTVSGLPTNIVPETPSLPEVRIRNVPNPFSTSTTIQWDRGLGPVSLQVFDAAGRLVRTLINNATSIAPGNAVAWDGRDDANRPVASGIYFLRLSTPVMSETRKMVLIR